ncbi:PLP-dependent transferase, partial [Alicyclobacillaceae bacterium I2511]
SMETWVVHGGERQPALTETPTVGPVHFSTTYTRELAAEMDAILGGEAPGFTYGRHGNPTVAALASTLATMEQGDGALLYGSGMAALQGALLSCGLKAGDGVLLSRDLYGATAALVRQVFGGFGIVPQFMDMTDTAAVRTTLAEGGIKAIVLETLSNPLLRVVDLPAILAAARQQGVPSIVDNTFATPYLCQPLTMGADLVVHSTTKYLNGHGDVTGGVVVSRQDRLKDLAAQQKLTGGIMSPMDAWLTQRGLKTFSLRFGRQLGSAEVLARRLQEHPQVNRVYHPSLIDHPDYARAQELLPLGQGAVVAFEIQGGRAQVFRLMESLQLVVPGTTVGDVYSLLLYPTIASHRSLSPEERAAAGITEGLVRLSVGIEQVEDIWRDLVQALARAVS